MSHLAKKLTILWTAVKEGHKRYQQQLKAGKGEWKVVKEYKYMVYKKDELFDIFPRKSNGEEDRQRIKQVEDSWGVKMGRMEEIYYEDMKSERKMECGRGVDPVWHQAMMKKQRERERLEAYREKRGLPVPVQVHQGYRGDADRGRKFCYSSEEEEPQSKSEQRDKTATEFGEALAFKDCHDGSQYLIQNTPCQI